MNEPQENKAADTGEPNLDAIRDERCLPVARNVLKLMGTDLIPEEDLVADGEVVMDNRVLAQKYLALMRDADLNTTTETTYVPQLILAALAGLNASVQEATVFPIDEKRLNGIARKILIKLSETDIDLTKKAEENKHEFEPVKVYLNEIFALEELTYIEIKYIMDKVFNSFTALNNLVSGSLEDSMRRAESKLFQVEDMSDITMKKLDAVLTS